MNKIIIKKYPNRCWNIAEIFKNNEKIADANLFYEVTPDWILIYETAGGTGTGWSKGTILSKINIADCELETQTIRS